MALSKNQIKFISSLHKKKFREEHQLFIVEGDKIAKEIFQQNKYQIISVYASDSWINNNIDTLKQNNVEYYNCSSNDLERISNMKNAPQVLFILKSESFAKLNPSGKINLVLDNIQDPGNLGTIIRTADWFAIDNIYCSEQTVELYNPKVIQASMGSFLRVNIEYTDINELLTTYKQIPCYATVLNGENIYDIKFPEEMFLIIGNEGKGISPELLTSIKNIPVSIPKFGQAESLNAGIAAAIFCAMLKR